MSWSLNRLRKWNCKRGGNFVRSRQLSVQLKAANQDLQSEITERQRVEAALKVKQNSGTGAKLLRRDQGLEADGTVAYAKPFSQNVLGFPEELEGEMLLILFILMILPSEHF